MAAVADHEDSTLVRRDHPTPPWTFVERAL